MLDPARSYTRRNLTTHPAQPHALPSFNLHLTQLDPALNPAKAHSQPGLNPHLNHNPTQPLALPGPTACPSSPKDLVRPHALCAPTLRPLCPTHLDFVTDPSIFAHVRLNCASDPAGLRTRPVQTTHLTQYDRVPDPARPHSRSCPNAHQTWPDSSPPPALLTFL
jgi:hypothetical protein